MRRVALTASNLVLAALAAVAQDGGTDDELRTRLRSLAAGGGAKVEALKALEPLPVAQLERIHRLARLESPDVRAAVRRIMPPASWILSDEKTIGDARARLRQYVSDLATTDAESQEKRWEAIRQLTLRGNPEAGAAVLKVYREHPTHSHLGVLLSILGSPDQTPVLLEILEASGNAPYGAIEAIAAVGDLRAEKALLKRMEIDAERQLQCLKPLSIIGGEHSYDTLRNLAADAKAPKWMWNNVTQARMNLRDPRLPADLLSVSGAERHGMKEVYRGLVRMGDRSVVPDLAKRLEDPNAKAEDRMAALQVLAVLGTREQSPVVLKCLEDSALAGTAADALAEFGDPAAAVPLAIALKQDPIGKPFARALMIVPLQGVESHVLEILNDPAGNKLSFFYALGVAGRLKSDQVRKKLVALLMDTKPRSYDGFEVARAVFPMLGKKDLRRLSRSSSRDAPHEDDRVRYPRLAVRAALGDENARREFVQAAIRGGLPIWWSDDRRNHLFQYPGPALDLLPEVKAALKSNPALANGVDYMIRLCPDEAWPYVENAIKDKSGPGVLGDLAALTKGEKHAPGFVHALSMLDDAVLETLARRLPEEAVRQLRKSVMEESLRWRHESEVKDPRNPAAPPAKRVFYRTNLVGDFRLGMLAARRDPVLESVYRSWLRSSQQQGVPFTNRMTALALADLGADDMYDTFVRFTRAEEHERRSLGARCLARLGDRRAIKALAPLLDDHERTALGFINPMPDDPVPPLLPRVCDDAADALEVFSGQKFPGARAERIAAIKAWLAKE